MRALALLLVVGVACGATTPPLPRAGARADPDKGDSNADDGGGVLALASIQIIREENGEEDGLTAAGRRVQPSEYGGDAYGGGAYGGNAYANLIVPAWPSAVTRTPKHAQLSGLSGSIEGTILWRGQPPARVHTACGAIEPLRVGPDRAIAGVLVFIERVTIGRAQPSDGTRPASIGGTLVKRGCALAPIVQIVTPLPAALAVHTDTKPVVLRATPPRGPDKLLELQPAASAGVQLIAGITRVDSPDGSIGAAWVHAADTPYYALTDDRGRYRIDELAAGTYDVTIWQPPLATLAQGKLVYGAPIVVHRSVKVELAKSTRLDVSLSR